MRKNYLLNLAYLSLIIVIFILFKTLGFASAAFLRQDIIYYMAYIPVTTILMLFSCLYVAYSTNWKDSIKNTWLSIFSIVISIAIYFLSIFLSDFYDTFGSGAQWLTLSLMLGMILVSIPFTLIKRKNQTNN